jgi:hypothetical protein
MELGVAYAGKSIEIRPGGPTPPVKADNGINLGPLLWLTIETGELKNASVLGTIIT